MLEVEWESKDGGATNVVASNQAPYPIDVVASAGGALYWLTREQSPYGGTGALHVNDVAPRTLVPNLESPRALVVDEAHIYWADSANGAIYRVPVDMPADAALPKPEVFTLSDSPIIGWIALDATHVYWIATSPIDDAGNRDVVSVVMKRAKCGGPSSVIAKIGAAKGLVVAGEYVYAGSDVRLLRIRK